MQKSAGRAWRWATACLVAGSAWTTSAIAQKAEPVAEALPSLPAPPAQVAPYKTAPIVAAPAPAPAPAAAPAAPCEACQATKAGPRWDTVPPIQPLPKPGYFPGIPPTGKGYYSLLDAITGNELKAPPKYPYPRVSPLFSSFFDVDWRYLDKPDNTETDFFDCLKRQKFLDDKVMFTTGGEFRYRYNHEVNSRLLNTGPVANRGKINDYQLFRTRVYGDLWLGDNFRVFVEGIDARSSNENLPPQAVDRNAADLLNAFIDIRTIDVADNSVWVRIGRQELLYGSQRLISTLDWVNTRRTFQGGKVFWKNDKWSVDAFVVQPIVPNFSRFDSVDNNQVFSGLWTTYRPNKQQAIDMYVLNLDRAGPAVTGQNGVVGPSNVTTLGSRYVGQQDQWLWDVEGMFQAGTYSNQNLVAGAVTTGGGYWFKNLPGTPTAWIYYDYASGDNNPNLTTSRSTFDQLFPFGHYYFGFIDVVGRRNIQDLNTEITFYPTKWLTVNGQFHCFALDTPKDALYNAGGAPIRQDRTGRAGTNVGQEFDLLTNIHLDKHSDILISYSHLFAGDFIQQTATTPKGRVSPDYLYVQYSYRW